MFAPPALIRLIWVIHNDTNNMFTGLGVAAASRIRQGTTLMFHHGRVVSKEMVRKTPGYVDSHLMNVEGTGCAIDGPHSVLFNNVETPDLQAIYEAPAPLMSLTNSSRNYKEANCRKLVDHGTAMHCVDDTVLDTTIWLETTRDIEMGEELVWDYLVR